MALQSPNDIDFVVQTVRNQCRASIIQQCGIMQVLDMTQAIGINDIYVNVNVLETIIGSRRLEIADLLHCEPEDFNRWSLSKITEERVPGLAAVEKYSKLIILGKPGAGKTTFLKYLAIRCSLGEFQVNKVPIFITLKDFAEAENTPTLLAYIKQILQNCGVKKYYVDQILKQSRAIILLDGLDEVREEDSQRTIQQIKILYKKFANNRFIISSRITDKIYIFEKFTELELADFDCQQVYSFTHKWFASETAKADKFMQKIQESESIQELANNPLLLTLLCLMFQETSELPWNRLELYQEGLKLLLNKWDVQKNVERSAVFKKLSSQQKQDLFSQIAFTNFQQNKYFFRQQELENYIADYICNLPNANTDPEKLKRDSLTLLKSIEAQHGLLVERAKEIYSFSHLTFQEYFTARQIAICSHPQSLETALQQLANRITEKRWHEVFLLTVGMLRKADYLIQLMKQKIDGLVAQDQLLQAVLAWANHKSNTVNVAYRQAAIRAFYITLACTLLTTVDPDSASLVKLDTALDANAPMKIAFSLDRSFVLNSTVACDLLIDRTLFMALAIALKLKVDFTLVDELVSWLDLGITLAGIAQQLLLSQALLVLKKQLPNLESPAIIETWYLNRALAWIEELRAIMIAQRQIGHDWRLSYQQIENLRQYYYANQLLLDCLNSDCYLTRSVRSHIEETLFLPTSELIK